MHIDEGALSIKEKGLRVVSNSGNIILSTWLDSRELPNTEDVVELSIEDKFRSGEEHAHTKSESH